MNKKITFVLFLLSVFMLGFLPVKDTDFGWHFRCGKEFLESGILCTKNRFSYFLSDYRAYNPSFFYDFILAFIFDNFGFLGVSFLGGVIFALIAYFFSKLLENIQLWLKMVAFYAFFFLSRSTLELGLRSQIFTIFFFVVTLFLVKQGYTNFIKKSHKHFFALPAFLFPLLMFLWVNTHIGFFTGLIVTSFWFAEQAYYAYTTKNRQSNQTLIVTGTMLLLSFLATLANPFGFNVYREIVSHVFAPMNQIIAEWVAPPFWPKVFVIIVAVIAFISLLDNKSLRIFKLLLLLFFTLLTLMARRNLPFFYLISLFIILQNYSKKIRQLLLPNLQLALLIPIVVTLITIPQLTNTIRFDTSWNIYCNEGLTKYPCQAVEKNRDLSGNIFAAYEWGGFLIWQLPEAKVFVDGRMPAWTDENGDSPYQVYLYIIQARRGWNERLKQLETDYLLIQTSTFLDLLLQEKAAEFGWKEQYRDKTAAVYRNQASLLETN